MTWHYMTMFILCIKVTTNVITFSHPINSRYEGEKKRETSSGHTLTLLILIFLSIILPLREYFTDLSVRVTTPKTLLTSRWHFIVWVCADGSSYQILGSSCLVPRYPDSYCLGTLAHHVLSRAPPALSRDSLARPTWDSSLSCLILEILAHFALSWTTLTHPAWKPSSSYLVSGYPRLILLRSKCPPSRVFTRKESINSKKLPTQLT